MKTGNRGSSIKTQKKVKGLWWETGSFARSWSRCGRSVRARVWPGVAAPWLLGSPRCPVMMSLRWGPHPQVAGTCVWKCSSPNHPGPAVKDKILAMTQIVPSIVLTPPRLQTKKKRVLTFSAWTSIWLLDVVTMTSSGEKSRTSTVNWYESPRVFIFPAPPKPKTRWERMLDHGRKQEYIYISFFPDHFPWIFIYAICQRG